MVERDHSIQDKVRDREKQTVCHLGAAGESVSPLSTDQLSKMHEMKDLIHCIPIQ